MGLSMPYTFAVAPMLDYTDRHARYLFRLIAPHVILYTEMITAAALINGNADQLLDFDKKEKYLVLQLGGSDPQALAFCARMAESKGYDEINLNVGCPSSRVAAGRFGACLMLDPHLVAACIASMQASTSLPISVKCRIGVDDHDSYENLFNFISIVASAGCQSFVIHARKAWLSGLSPKQNREIPPLSYATVRKIKQDFPQLNIMLNGGIKSIADIEREYHGIDGIMLGRAAYANPYILAEIEKKYFGSTVLTRQAVVEKFIPYVHERLYAGDKLTAMTRHLLGLFHGQPQGANFRRCLSNPQKKINIDIISEALKLVS